MTPAVKTRFGQRVHVAIEGECKDMATRVNMSVEDVTEIAYTSVLKHRVCKEIVKGKCEEVKRSSEYGVVIDALRAIWEHISMPENVASTSGWMLRRNILGCIAGPGLSFKAAYGVLGGWLKRETFGKAKRRREDAMGENDLQLL